MAIKKKCGSEIPDRSREHFGERFVIWAVRLFEPPLEFGEIDPAPPQLTMAAGSRWHEAQPAAGPGAQSSRLCPDYDSRVDFVFATVAIDGRARSPGDDRPQAAAKRTPGKAVDQGIGECFKRWPALGGQGDEAGGEITSGMRDRQNHRQGGTRAMDEGMGKIEHG